MRAPPAIAKRIGGVAITLHQRMPDRGAAARQRQTRILHVPKSNLWETTSRREPRVLFHFFNPLLLTILETL